MTGTQLRVRRDRLGLSQSELAGALGVHPNTLARWERGELAVQHPEMLRLAVDRLIATFRSQNSREFSP